MKKIAITLFFAILINGGLVAQSQSQTNEDPFSYKINGLVYVKEFNSLTRSKTQTQKIPKTDLLFNIVSKEIESSDNSTYYVIQFPPITDNTVTVAGESITLKGNTNFVNSDDNDKYFWIRKDELDNYLEDGFIVKSYDIPNTRVTYGANISLPFKLRPKTDGQNIKITPEIMLGGYLGAKWRISRKEPFYLSLPIVTLGLATLNVNDNNNPSNPDKGDGTVLGFTGTWGGVFQLNDFQFGFVMGWDRAAGEIGKDWIYNGKPWYSFSIGYTFIGDKPDKDKK